MNLNLHLTGKRKQALLESNLPGISCSTGMVKRGCGNAVSLSTQHSKSKMPKKTQQRLAVFILLNGPKNGGAYTTIFAEHFASQKKERLVYRMGKGLPAANNSYNKWRAIVLTKNYYLAITFGYGGQKRFSQTATCCSRALCGILK